MSKSNFYVIDGHGLIYRSFYAISELRNSKGEPTNAVFGFVRAIKSFLKDFKPTHFAVCFDSKGKTFREERYSEYKIQRPPMPDDLRPQIPIVKDILSAFHIPIFEKKGFEADDLIALLVKKSQIEGINVVIASDDKDMFQLADKDVHFFSSRKNEILDTKALKEKLGFDPTLMADFLGLAGDSADNIPGVAGIGKVTATNLINEFGNLDNIIKNIEKVKSLKVKEKLMNQKDQAFMSRDLAVLETDIDVEVNFEKLRVTAPDSNRLHAMFKDLEFKSLADEYGASTVRKSAELVMITKEDDCKKLIVDIKSAGVFSFIAQGGDFQDFLSQAKLFISLEKEHVYQIEQNQISLFKEVFKNKKIEKITYDLKAGLKELDVFDIELSENTFDVMLGAFLSNGSGATIDLRDIMWKFLRVSVAEKEEDFVLTADFMLLRAELLKKLKEFNLENLLMNIEIPLSYVLFLMEKEGVALDLKLLKKLSKECEEKINVLSKEIFKLSGEEFNLNSPKQLSKILFEKLEMPVIKKTKTGFSTNEEVLKVLAQDYQVPLLVLEYRQLAKLKSTYIDALPNLIDQKTGRIHTNFVQTGAETGRLSSKSPNLQNIPIRTKLGRQIRSAFIPGIKGWDLVSADYSQIELRILAHLSKDEGLKKAFKENQDIHSFTAQQIFDVSESDLTKDMRMMAKRVNFGIVYGISAFGLSKDLKVPQSEAQEFIDRYFDRYPLVREFMDSEIKNCERRGYVLTLLNRRRYLPEILSKNNAIKNFAQRQAINTPVQGTAADLMKIAMINVHKEMTAKKMKAKMLITVHDEIVLETPQSERENLVSLLKTNMENALELSVPVKVSVKVGKNWLDMKDV